MPQGWLGADQMAKFLMPIGLTDSEMDICRFKITAPLMGVGVCHCTDCQKASGGGPNYVALAPKTAFEITRGEARVYFSKGDSGADAGRPFCPNCGTPL